MHRVLAIKPKLRVELDPGGPVILVDACDRVVPHAEWELNPVPLHL